MMHAFASITLDKHGDIPIYRQLSEAIREMITDGILKPNDKLPPIRVLAKILSVNSMTVVSAYKYLESRKYVYAEVGSGTYVAPPTAPALPAPMLRNQYSAPQVLSGCLSDAINFADTSTDASLFPVTTFRQAFDAVLERDGGSAFDYQDSQGYEPLRESLCTYLDALAVKASPDRIQIISGAQQGLDILAKVLLNPGDALLAEQPTFYGAVGAFASRGANVYEVPLENDGLDMDVLETFLKTHRPKGIYVMPNFQTPTGVSYSPEKKRRLLELAYQYDTYVIEEDNQNDFYYDGRRRVPLKALDYRNRVIYVKSFSKILMPGLRLGFMALPKKLAVTTVKRNTDIATSGFIQRAFDMYLRDGGFTAHCAFMRGEYGRRYQRMLHAVEAYLAPYVTYEAPGGGLSFWLTPIGTYLHGAIDEMYDQFLRHNVIVTPGSVFSSHAHSAFRVSFSAVPETRVEEGMDIIASVMRTYSN